MKIGISMMNLLWMTIFTATHITHHLKIKKMNDTISHLHYMIYQNGILWDFTKPDVLHAMIEYIEMFAQTNCSDAVICSISDNRARNILLKKGFIKIAKEADVPVIVGFIDKKTKTLGVIGLLDMQGTDMEIMERLKKHYIGITGLRKNKFETGYE